MLSNVPYLLITGILVSVLYFGDNFAQVVITSIISALHNIVIPSIARAHGRAPSSLLQSFNTFDKCATMSFPYNSGLKIIDLLL
ncbi:hypothetical protein NQ314_017340 [Rhamnusium bicolor]|uniref:Uncharacterized protein n=1 Tax=Rhamnusium bicolor TaxID=1586634 RepID=A0AAV8WUP9_9CUCU|nr:hypothetical protein NQ314_017340 [Rhamnusium bicolor]